MPIIPTLKHELEYDTDTGQVIFNRRNKTPASPVNDAFPQRLVVSKMGKSDDIVDNTIVLGDSYIENHTVILGSKSKVENHTVII